MRREAPPASPDGKADAAARYTGAAPASLYGFVFCRARRDAAAKRGAITRAVVVLAESPLSAALRPLAAAAAAAYFAKGAPGLAAAYDATLHWPAPDPDEPACVCAGGAAWVAAAPAPRVLPPPADDASDAARHPCAPLPPLATAAGAPAPHGAFHEADVYTPFASLSSSAWTLWEATMTATPTLILARDPGVASGAVAALVAAIAPLPYAADFRPFLQVHDPQAAALAAACGAPARAAGLPRLVGATSPYFARELGGWPLVLRLGCGPTAPPSSATTPPPSPTPASRLRRAAAAVAGGAGAALGAAAALVPRRARADRGLAALQGPDALFLGATFKPASRPDRALLRRLGRANAAAAGGGADAAARAAAANSAALRSHFRALTEAALSLFTPYWKPVPVPPGFGPLPARAPAPRPPLSHAAFLDGLPPVGQLPAPLIAVFGSRAGLVSFYRRFLTSPNFASWFGRAAARSRAWQDKEWAEAASARGVAAAAPPPRPVEATASSTGATRCTATSSSWPGADEPALVDAWLSATEAATAAAAAGAPDASALAAAAAAALAALPADVRAAVAANAAAAAATPLPLPARASFPGVAMRRSASAGGSSDGGRVGD